MKGKKEGTEAEAEAAERKGELLHGTGRSRERDSKKSHVNWSQVATRRKAKFFCSLFVAVIVRLGNRMRKKNI